jgi:putative endonuclease
VAVTYVLYSDKTDQFYVGSSHKDSVESRLKSHNSGKVRSTKYGRPWKVVEVETYGSYTDARKREIELKKSAGRRWLNRYYGHLKKKKER